MQTCFDVKLNKYKENNSKKLIWCEWFAFARNKNSIIVAFTVCIRFKNNCNEKKHTHIMSEVKNK